MSGKHTKIVIFGPMRGRMGGVATSLDHQRHVAENLVEEPQSIPTDSVVRFVGACLRSVGRRRHGVAIINASRPLSLGVMCLSSVAFAERRVIFLHGLRVTAYLEGRNLASHVLRALISVVADRVWATNHDIARRMQLSVPALQIDVVQPTSSELRKQDVEDAASHTHTLPTSDKPLRLLTLSYNRESLYNVDLVLEAYARVRKVIPSASLRVIAYGPRVSRSVSLEHQLSLNRPIPPGVEFTHGMEHDSFMQLLAQTDVLVRATSSDGDSVSLREALSCRVRVIASDVVSRPRGCELFGPLDAGNLADAITNGGRVSTIEGPGLSLQEAFWEVVEAADR